MYLINNRLFTFLIIIMIFSVITYLIFYYFIENGVAENITHSEYISILTIGTIDIHTSNTSISSSNDSLIVKAISDDKYNTDSDILQVTTTKGKLVYLMHFNFMERFIDRFPRLAILLYLFSQKSERGD